MVPMPLPEISSPELRRTEAGRVMVGPAIWPTSILLKRRSNNLLLDELFQVIRFRITAASLPLRYCTAGDAQLVS
jgi:hypothetical protein